MQLVNDTSGCSSQGLSWSPSNRYLNRSKLASTRLCNNHIYVASFRRSISTIYLVVCCSAPLRPAMIYCDTHDCAASFFRNWIYRYHISKMRCRCTNMLSVLYPGTGYSTKHMLFGGFCWSLPDCVGIQCACRHTNIWNFRPRAASHNLEVEFVNTAWHQDIQATSRQAESSGTHY